MFSQLFSRPFAVAYHHNSPFAVERQRYLSRLIEEGRSPQTLRNIERAGHFGLGGKADFVSSNFENGSWLACGYNVGLRA